MNRVTSSFAPISLSRLVGICGVAIAIGCGGGEACPIGQEPARPQDPGPLGPTLGEVTTETPFVLAGTEVEITWTTDADTTVTVSPQPARMEEATSRQLPRAVVVPTETTTYTVTATRNGKSTSKSVVVTVLPGIATDIVVNHVVCDAARGKLVASVPSADPTLGNRLAVVDPITGAVDRSIPIGSEPGEMALSDDGTTLWVAIDGASSFRKVDLRNDTAGPLVPLPTDSAGVYYVEQMLALEGSTSAVAITYAIKNRSPARAGTAVFDDGVARPKALRGLAGSLLARGSTASELIGRASVPGSGDGLVRFTVDATGIVMGPAPTKGIGADDTVRFVRAGNRLLFADGQAYDATTFAKLGTYVLEYGKAIAADPSNGTVYRSSEAGAIRSFDAETLAAKGNWAISKVDFTKIVPCGEGVAVVGTRRRLMEQTYLPRLTLVPKAGIR
jgi:hypothetical protein